MNIPIQAWYFPTQIDLKKVRERYPDKINRLTDPLHVQLADDRCVCLTSFGVLVFWPFDDTEALKVADEIRPFLGDESAVGQVTDRIAVATDMPETKVLFDEIQLKGAPSFDEMGLISQLLAQSIALNYLEIEVDKALERIEKHVSKLKKSGRLMLSDKTAFKNIGFAMDIRHRVLTSLALFDKPEVTWESEDLEFLYEELHNYFDIEDRHRTIARKLTFISDNTSLLYEFLSTRKSHQLEWIIIWLISFEILLFFIEHLFL